MSRINRQAITEEGNTVNSSILNWKFQDLNAKFVVEIYHSDFEEIFNSTFQNLGEIALEIDYSTVNRIDKLNMTSNDVCLNLYRSKVDEITGSYFDTCGTKDVLYGGAIHISSSNSSLSQCTFTNNIAISGASIGIECDLSLQCYNSILNSTFNGNNAIDKGGAVYYNLNRPNMTDCIFENNTAPYGKNIASYAVKIVSSNTTNNHVSITGAASDLLYEEHLIFDLIDFDNQKIPNNQNIVKITSLTSNATIKGTDYAKLINGTASFDNLIFVKRKFKNAHLHRHWRYEHRLQVNPHFHI